MKRRAAKAKEKKVSAKKVTPKPEKEKEPGTRAKRKTTKKVLAKKVEKKLTPKKEKAEKKEPKKVSLPKKIAVKKPARKAAEKIKKPEEVEKRIEIPRFEEAYPPVPTSGLPAEYGEDRIALMTVDPQRLFAYWEVRKDTHKRLGGNLALRVYDVTGVDFNGQNANSFFDINIYERVGNWYIDVRRPESDFVVDIGVTYPDGNFLAVARSNKASTPQVRVSAEEGALPLYKEGLPYGYEKTGDK